MKINWNLLINKFGVYEATARFEILALLYVKTNFREYNWVLTKRSHDNNRDIHLKEYENDNIPNYPDKWAEAKYKKNSTSLKKKDIDPTILSGLINGNVELIIFISNGTIPASLITRNYLGGSIKNIEITYILKNQLENWLVMNPEIYKVIFDEPINKKIKESNIIDIKDITFTHLFNRQANFCSTTYFRIGNKYVLQILIYSTYETNGNIILKDYPFQFVDDSNYANKNHFSILPGINHIRFLVFAKKTFKGSIIFSFKIDNAEYNFNSKRIYISNEKPINLSYPQQLSFSQKINNMISLHEKNFSQQIITIYGKSGIGKTTLIKSIVEQNYIKFDTLIFNFCEDSQASLKSNYNFSLLCRFAIYISFGNLSFQINNTDQLELRKLFYKEIIEKKYNNVYLELFDGCYDSTVAKKALKNFIYKNVTNQPNQHIFYPLFFVFDNVQYLSIEEYEMFYKLIEYDKACNKNLILLSATENKFTHNKLEHRYLEFPFLFRLTGLQDLDIRLSMEKNINFYDKIEKYIKLQSFLKSPLFLKEYIYQIQIATNEEEIKKLIIRNEPFITSESILKIKQYFYLLDIIYQFKNGIKKKYIVEYFKQLNQKNNIKFDINKDLIFLNKNHYIFIENNTIYSYHDYIKNIYVNSRGEKFYNKKISNFFQYIYKYCSNDPNLDDFHILNLIIVSDKSKYTFYKKELINLFYKYINQTKYNSAYEIGTILYKKIIHKKRKTNEDCNILYLYTDCVNHCSGSNTKVLEVLNDIEQNSNNNLLLKLEIRASILNELFWQLQINQKYFADASMLEIDINNYLSTTKNQNMKKRLRRALYTCINRNMVSNLLVDQYNEGKLLLEKGIDYLIKYNIDYLESEKSTYYMDYARGISFYHCKKSYSLMKKALKGYNMNKTEHFRRIIICKIDIQVQKSINDLVVDFNKFDSQLEKLFNNNFKSECFKGILKRFACYFVLMYNKRQIDAASLNILHDKIDIALHNLDYKLNNRDTFLYNQIFAILNIKNDQEEAKKLLNHNKNIISSLGYSYKKINEHNINNIMSINYISWAKENETLNKETYYLDPRFW